ncbi:MAG: peptidoglycan-binding protein, partial [Acidobacteriota bacterium]|nr:peptidoglycan-binding protein [Acidobacteriota bacterium]
ALALSLFATALIAAPVQSKTAYSKKTVAKSGSHSVGARSAHAHTKSRRHPAPAPSYQLHPDVQRYTQIQQALADRGYFKGAVDGQWNDDSVDALKRFQTDQKLEGDGKISALTLTGLGLGPKHDGSTAATVPLSATNSSSETPDPLAASPPPEIPAETPPPITSDPN